jgi:hypothetical protein
LNRRRRRGRRGRSLGAVPRLASHHQRRIELGARSKPAITQW